MIDFSYLVEDSNNYFFLRCRRQCRYIEEVMRYLIDFSIYHHHHPEIVLSLSISQPIYDYFLSQEGTRYSKVRKNIQHWGSKLPINPDVVLNMITNLKPFRLRVKLNCRKYTRNSEMQLNNQK